MAAKNTPAQHVPDHVLLAFARVKWFASRVHRRLLRKLHEWFVPNRVQFYLGNCVVQEAHIDVYGQYSKRDDFKLDVIAEDRAIPGITKRVCPGTNDFVISLPQASIPLDGGLTFAVDSRRVYKQVKLFDPLIGRLSPMECMMTTMVKNEESRVVEWARWHLALGFDTVVVFLNNSTDGTRAALDAMHDERVVVVPFQYHALPGRYWNEVQRVELSVAGRFARHFSRWAAFLDVDEFILLKSQKHSTRPCIKEFLRGFESRFPEASAVTMQSFFYTNERQDYKPNQDVVESCRLRSVVPNLTYAKFIAKSGQLGDFVPSPHSRPAAVVADPEEIAIAHYWLTTSLYSHAFPSDLPTEFEANVDAVNQGRKM